MTTRRSLAHLLTYHKLDLNTHRPHWLNVYTTDIYLFCVVLFILTFEAFVPFQTDFEKMTSLGHSFLCAGFKIRSLIFLHAE